MKWSDLNNLEFKDIATAPAPIRYALGVLLFAAVVALGWYLIWADAWNHLENSRKEEASLKEAYVTKKIQAYHYETYKRRLGEIERSLGSMLRQLPNRSEMDALLTDINQLGVGRGLDFDLFRPGVAVPSDFYATIPVAIKVRGTYHDIGSFVSDLAKLPRIVTLHDVSLVPDKNSREISMEARLQTYRYLDEDEIAVAKKRKKARQK